MPTDMRKYGPGWVSFSRGIRFGRAQSRCECTGQCRGAGPSRCTPRCGEVHGQAAKLFRGRVLLTTAHLCRCEPPCTIAEHVIAACQRCHLAIDQERHLAAAAATRGRQAAQARLLSRQLRLGTAAEGWPVG